MSTGSAQQTSTTTAGVSPFAQNYVDAMLGAAQQQVFNMSPGEGGKMNITGIKPYVPFGAPMDAQGNVVPYGGQPQGMGWGSYGGQQGGYGQPQPQPQYQDYFNTPAALRGRFAGTDDSGMGRGPQRPFGYGFEGDTIGDGITKGGKGMTPEQIQQTYGDQNQGVRDFFKQFRGMDSAPGAGGGPSSMVYTPEQARRDAYLDSINPNFRQQREAQMRSMERQLGTGAGTASSISPEAFKNSSAYQDYLKSQEGAIGTTDTYDSPYFGLQGSGSAGAALDKAYQNWVDSQPDTIVARDDSVGVYQQPSTGYPTGTMQAGMGPGEQLAARSSVAGPSALQRQAYGSAAGMQTPGQYGEATDIGRAAGLGLLNTAGQAQGLQSLAQQAIQQGRQYGQDITDPSRTQAFMSPYMQNVVDAQQREAARRSSILGTEQAGQAVKAGAFGGSRAGLLEAERQRNLATQLGDIQAQGLQSAFQNAQQQQLNAQQQAMQGYTTGIQGYGQGIQGQTGAYGQAAQGAGTLSNIGGQQLGAQQSIANLQNTFGQQQQQNQQQMINQAMQNYQLQRMYPQQQMQWLSSMLSGLPVSSTGQVTNIPAPSLVSQLGGLGTAAVGAYGLGKKLDFFKKGGRIKSDPAGGIASIGLSKALNK